MDSWKRFNETSLPVKKAFYSKLNLEDITDEDYELDPAHLLSAPGLACLFKKDWSRIRIIN